MSKVIDLTGMRFDRLVVVNREQSGSQGTMWNCVCDCGNTVIVSGGNLRSGNTKSCGCIRKENLSSRQSKIIPTGTKFGRITVHEITGQDKYGNYLYRCSCECGNENYIVSGSILRRKSVISCGCYNREKSKTHGESKTRLYSIWADMRDRCNNEKSKAYPYYGGRGISVCDEWNHSFENFRDWAVENEYNDALTIDRVDVNGNYSPDNCRWATMKEQAQNRRPQNRKSHRYITANGETHTLAEWSVILGISQQTLHYRYKHGDTDDRLIREVK